MKAFSRLILFTLVLGCLILHMVPAAFIGCVVFILTARVVNQMLRYYSHVKSKILGAIIMAFVIVSGGVITIWMISRFLGNHDNLPGLTDKVFSILNGAKDELPVSISAYIPESAIAMKDAIADFLREHLKEVGTVGKEGVHTFAHILIGIAIALILGLHQFKDDTESTPFVLALRKRFALLITAFDNVFFAQFKISLINLAFTSIFLLVVLPLFGSPLPYSKTLILVTFLAGLIPVIGNLISNSMILIVSLGVSFKTAIASLVFLILIHKLEYFINARIVGSRIQASAWEILLSMLVMEAMFGFPGLLVAPILYAYIKSEMKEDDLI